MPLEKVFAAIDDSRKEALDSLMRLASQPSVSATGLGIRECAKLVESLLSDLGAAPKVYDVGEGSPVVTGEIQSNKNPMRTLLFYNHYDVQPPEPIELWESPPFTPTMKDGKVYARGIADDKGELIGRLKLTEAFLAAEGDVPCNFKFLFEGEEEVGSVHLHEYLKHYPEIFRADGVIWEFGGVDPKETPNVTLGVKGILYVELTAQNAKRDAHSSLGAIVDNPAWRLVGALNEIKNGDEILIPGWYDEVRPLSPEELQHIHEYRYESDSIKKDLGIASFIGGMDEEEAKRELVGKPTCTICGLNSGYTGKGSKTVLPSSALAKIDFRLVPDQDPDVLVARLKKHLEAKGFRDVQVTYSEGEKAKRTPPGDRISVAARDAAQEVYGRKPNVIISSPGTGPMYLFEAPCVAIGGGSTFSNAHAPNENLRVDLFLKGMKWVASTVDKFAKAD